MSDDTRSGNDLLMGGGGAPSAKFETVGTVVRGEIIAEPEAQQQRDIKTKELKTWDDGNPMMQVVVTLNCGEIDPTIEGDTGARRIFLKSNSLTAVRDAVKASGAKGLAIGGKLALQYTGNGTASGAGMTAPKLYAAAYEPPAPNILDIALTSAPVVAPLTVAAPIAAAAPIAVAVEPPVVTVPAAVAAPVAALDPNSPEVLALLAKLQGTPAA